MPLTPESAARKDRTNAKVGALEHRHFAVIAGIIAELRDEDRQAMADFFAERLAPTNPRFDRARFLKACGVE
jgi:hypothetical protein